MSAELACPSLFCDYKTGHAGHLKRHVMAMHPELEAPKSMPRSPGQYHCAECGDLFASTKSLSRHVKRIHQYIYDGSVQCPACQLGFGTHEGMVKHYGEQHNSGYEVHFLEFDDESIFKQWLKQLEYQCCASFAIRDSDAKGKRYRCSVAGLTLGSPPKKKMTTKGLTHCTAFVNAKIQEGKVSATFCQQHVHEPQPNTLKIKGSLVEEKIVQLLEIGLDKKQIIDVLRKDMQDFDSVPASYDYIVTERDVERIKMSHGLVHGRSDANDLVSTEMRSCEDSAVKYYRPPTNLPSANGFSLAIMTDLQAGWLKKYGNKGLVVDDTDAVPELLPARFMTDDDPVFWRGFKQAFPEATSQLLMCKWHLLNSWKRNLGKIDQVSLRETIMADLRTLVNITNREEFNDYYRLFTESLSGHGELKFLQYIKKYYEDRIEEWAAWNRAGSHFGTSMAAECWHRRLKAEVLQGNRRGRVDALIEKLISYPAKYAAHLHIQDYRYTSTTRREQEIVKAHKKAESLLDTAFQYEDGRILVKSATSDQVYQLTKSGSCDCNVAKNLHCRFCKCCPYEWRCTCLAANVAGVVCKHVHIIHLKYAINKADAAPVDENDKDVHQDIQDVPTYPEDATESAVPPVPEGDADAKERDIAINNAYALLHMLKKSKPAPAHSTVNLLILEAMKSLNCSTPVSMATTSTKPVPIRESAHAFRMESRAIKNRAKQLERKADN
ncbi:unnamed protein product, partial [Mesorhabditis spiculigera]